jgi:hypothetical protein
MVTDPHTCNRHGGQFCRHAARGPGKPNWQASCRGERPENNLEQLNARSIPGFCRKPWCEMTKGCWMLPPYSASLSLFLKVSLGDHVSTRTKARVWHEEVMMKVAQPENEVRKPLFSFFVGKCLSSPCRVSKPAEFSRSEGMRVGPRCGGNLTLRYVQESQTKLSASNSTFGVGRPP